jgi:hypothetical protein
MAPLLAQRSKGGQGRSWKRGPPAHGQTPEAHHGSRPPASPILSLGLACFIFWRFVT